VTTERWLVFDLDGTLVDSVPDLAAALNRLMRARGLAAFTHAEVTAMVGDGAAALVRRALDARGQPADETATEAFVADYTAHASDATRAFPGVMQTLRHLEETGWRMAVCTNKPVAAAREVLSALGMARFFASVGGGDSFPVRKPHPAHLLATLREAGGSPERAVMVGDHHNDVAAALGAKMPCIFAAWGYGAATMAEGAEAVATRFDDIPEIAARLVAS
jgi:phosphoglycolate phosphatase